MLHTCRGIVFIGIFDITKGVNDQTRHRSSCLLLLTDATADAGGRFTSNAIRIVVIIITITTMMNLKHPHDDELVVD